MKTTRKVRLAAFTLLIGAVWLLGVMAQAGPVQAKRPALVDDTQAERALLLAARRDRMAATATKAAAEVDSPPAAEAAAEADVQAEAEASAPAPEADLLTTDTERPRLALADRTAARTRAAAPQIRLDDIVPAEYMDLVHAVGQEFNLNPRLIAAVCKWESNWHAAEVGRHGDTGLMQIIPSTAAWIAARMGLERYDLKDARTNMSMGVWYLQWLIQRNDGDWTEALAEYNGGSQPPPVSYRYAERILRTYRGE